MKNLRKMKNYINLLILALIALSFGSCDPNKDLYNELDELRQPYNTVLDYTLTDADYNRFRGFIADNKAFSDSFPAMDYIPRVLKVRFVSLRENSRVLATFNQFLLDPYWWKSGFGYVLTPTDYLNLNGDPNKPFDEENPASGPLNVPDLLLTLFPTAQEGDLQNAIYRFRVGGEIFLNLDVYLFDGQKWVLQETQEDIPYIGYELTTADYQNFGGSVAQSGFFSEAHAPEVYLPALLRNLRPFAVENDVQVVRYRYRAGTQTVARTDKYVFDGIIWNKTPYVIEKTEQYIFGALGWAFDPTVTFKMRRDDYMFLAEIDPIPHETFNDFGYYYGASAFYSNFDIRLNGRRLNKDTDGNYRDAALGAIFEAEGAEAANAELLRRINEEGLIKLLQHKFPDATPQVGGIDVHYFIEYETFADNWTRRYPVAEFICVAAGSPPQFEFVSAVGH